MNRLDRIEAKLAESESTDRDFPRESPERREIIVRRDDLRALVRLAVAMRLENQRLGGMKMSDEEAKALAALEEPCADS